MADQPSSKQTFPDQGQGSCAPRVTTKLAQHGSDTRTCVLCLVAQCVQLFMTPGTLACQAPHPWGFSRQEYWTGLTCPPPGDLPNPGIEPRPPALQADSLPSEPPGKPKNTRVGGLSLLQGIFPTQESNWCLLHCRRILYQLSHQGSPRHKKEQKQIQPPHAWSFPTLDSSHQELDGHVFLVSPSPGFR